MNMPSMPMSNDHDIFWRENQIIVTLHSNKPLVSAAGVYNGASILQELKLEAQLSSLNQFLKENKINYTLSFFEEEVKPQESHPAQQSSPISEQEVADFNPPPGVYLFGLGKPIPSGFGELRTSIVTFFNFREDTSASSLANTSSEANAGSQIDKDNNDDKEPVPLVRIVNQLNRGLGDLNKRQVPIGVASPVFLCGGTPSNTPGCPLTPPIPVEDDCALWHFTFPKLIPDDLQKMTGEGVTVFILDTLPELEAIEKAANKAQDDNLLLSDVSKHVKFNYSVPLHPLIAPDGSPIKVGKDVYGQHYAAVMPDHDRN